MATIKIDISKEVEAINAHLKATSFKAGRLGDTRSTIKNYYAQAKPILMLLAQILGASVGKYITALLVALDTYTSDSLKASPGVLAKICKAWAFVSPFVATAIQLFGKNKDWSKALQGLSAGINNICANPA